MAASAPEVKSIAILGAGVIGLTIALLLREHGGYDVTIVARELPTDVHSTEFASPWAVSRCVCPTDLVEQKWDKATFLRWKAMWENGTLDRQTLALMPFVDEHPVEYASVLENWWFRDLTSRFQHWTEEGVARGATFDSFCISVPRYTEWLVDELTKGSRSSPRTTATLPGPPVKFLRTPFIKGLSALGEMRLVVPSCELVVNASGLGPAHLEDVNDADVYPIRGQTVLIRCEAMRGDRARCVMRQNGGSPLSKPLLGDSLEHPILYVIPRAQSGLVICGGTFEEGEYDTTPNPVIAQKILRGCAAICPEVIPTDDDRNHNDGDAWRAIPVVGINVGLRPARRGGPRLELGAVTVPGKDGESELKVVHAYGFGKAGYQNSFGVAEAVRSLIDQAFLEKERQDGV